MPKKHVLKISNEKDGTSIEKFLDEMQRKKKGRVECLLKELEELEQVEKDFWEGKIATNYGIRGKTIEEYLDDWEKYGLIEVKNGKIKWVEKKESQEEN